MRATTTQVLERKEGVAHSMLIMVIGEVILCLVSLHNITVIQCCIRQETDRFCFKEIAFGISIVGIVIGTITPTTDTDSISIEYLPTSHLIYLEAIGNDHKKWIQKSDHFISVTNTKRKIRNPSFLQIQQGFQKNLQNPVEVPGCFSIPTLATTCNTLTCLGMPVNVGNEPKVGLFLRCRRN
jgi:hypothetical protein